MLTANWRKTFVGEGYFLAVLSTSSITKLKVKHYTLTATSSGYRKIRKNKLTSQIIKLKYHNNKISPFVF